MQTVELIKNEIATLDKNEIADLLNFIHNLEKGNSNKLFNNLKNIQIEAPVDFSGNIDGFLYSGDNH